MIITQVVQVAVAEVQLYSVKESRLPLELIMFLLDKVTLLLTMRLIERAADIDPENSLYATESAEQAVMLGDMESAMKMYKRSAQLDESNVAALQGMIRCYILQGLSIAESNGA